MNILLLNHYAGSTAMGMEFRPYYLAREWVKMGHDVRIVGGDFSHLRIKNPKIKKDFTTQHIDGIKYTWLKTGEYEGNGVKRALSMLRYVSKLYFNAERIARAWKPDVVIGSSTYPLDTYAAQKIAKCAKATCVHEVHDMWPITLIELGGMKKTHPFVVMMQFAENSFCKHTDRVVSLLPCAKDYFVKHGMKPDHFRCVMNGVVKSEWDDPQPLPEEHEKLLDELRAKGKFIVCFFGSITDSYCIDYLIDAVKKLGNKNVAAVIVGDGTSLAKLKKQAASCGPDSVYFLPKIPKLAIPTMLSKTDCLYVGAKKNDMFRFGICMNKLFDSMMSGKPILYAVDAPNNFITDYDCGVSVEAEDTDALVKGLDRLVKMPLSERNRLGANGRKAVLENFTYEALAKQFIDAVK